MIREGKMIMSLTWVRKCALTDTQVHRQTYRLFVCSDLTADSFVQMQGVQN